MKFESDNGLIGFETKGDKLIIQTSNNESFEFDYDGDLLGTLTALVAKMKAELAAKDASLKELASKPAAQEAPAAKQTESVVSETPFGTDAAAPSQKQEPVVESFKAQTYAGVVLAQKPEPQDIEALRVELFELAELKSPEVAAKVKTLLADAPYIKDKCAYFKADLTAVSESAYNDWLDDVIDSFESISTLSDMKCQFAFAGPRKLVMDSVDLFNANGLRKVAAPQG